MKKRILKGFEEGLKELINFIKKMFNTMIYFAVATLYLIDWILDSFYDFVAYFYKNINKRLQKTLFYLIICVAILGVYSRYENQNIEEVIINKVEAKELENAIKNENEVVIEPTAAPVEDVCVFDEISCQIKEVAQRYGIDYKIAIAIAKAEAGSDYSSDAFVYKNNVGGTFKNNVLRTFNTLEEGMEFFVANLKYLYFDMGLDTLEEIQPKYCPIGAANDPNNLNSNWLRNTKAFYNELVRLESR